MKTTSHTLRLPLLGAALAASTAPALAQQAPRATENRSRPNVLMIAVDDLRPALGCYGDRLAKSPSIDALAASGVVFERAYCQQAVCSPSRNSLLTGLRPDTIGIYDLATFFRTRVPDAVTLPQLFKQNGYTSEHDGKIFHIYHNNIDDALSWSDASQTPDRVFVPGQGIVPADNVTIQTAAQTSPALAAPNPNPNPNPNSNGNRRQGNQGNQNQRPSWGAPDVGDSELEDGRIADRAIGRLQVLAQARREKAAPFFLAVGFHKPHLPFVAPKKYWDRHDRADFAPSDDRSLPEGAPPWAAAGPGEARTYADIPKAGPIPDDLARTLRRGYYASVSYMDAQVGRVLAEVDRLGLRQNTIAVLWGDHGFQLGENGAWAKHNNFEISTRAPLIVRAPGVARAGAKTRALSEFVDIFPSLCELAGLQAPAGLEGTSFVPLLREPSRAWKRAAFSQWPRQPGKPSVGMGHSMRTERYRLTRWSSPDPEQRAVELYDYHADPREDVNLAAKPESKALVDSLLAQLERGWKAARPR